MNSKLAYLRERAASSIWIIPLGLCAICALLGVLMLWLDRQLGTHFSYFKTYAMPLDSARQVLGVVAGSVINVGGVAFSVTMVALTLTSGQYGPKVLRAFLQDNASKLSLGLFLGTFVYTLVILTTFADTDRPRLTVFAALVLAFAALIAFVRFIHRTSTNLQADKIINRIGKQLQGGLADLVKDGDETDRVRQTLPWRRAARSRDAALIATGDQGYVQTIDYQGLVSWCEQNDCMLQVRLRAGDLVLKGMALFKLYGQLDQDPERVVDTLNKYVIIGAMRTPFEDVEHSVAQLNQIAARALSPGINDPGTAITCIDWFGVAVAQVIDLEFPGCVMVDAERRPRLLIRTPTFAGIMKAIYAPLRQYGRGDMPVIVRLLESFCQLAELTYRRDRLELLATHGDLVRGEALEDVQSSYDFRDVRQRHRKLIALTRGSR